MNVTELIQCVLTSLRNQFYGGQTREFKRDERALLRAVATYGYECDQRGWEFSAGEILHDIMELLNEIKRAGAEIGYLPVYLQGAVKRRIGQRAEELSAKAKLAGPRAHKIIAGLARAEVIREKSDTEVLSALYRDLKGRRGKRAARGKNLELGL